MNFTYEGADLSKTIKSYVNDNNNHYIEYLDGTSSLFHSESNKIEEQIKEEMVEQAIDREKNFKTENYKIRMRAGLLGTELSGLGTVMFANKYEGILSLIFISLSVVGLKTFKDNRKAIRELKKYKMFLEMYPYINESNEWLYVIDPEPINLPPFDITTLDKYSYYAVKSLYEVFKIKQKQKEK